MLPRREHWCNESRRGELGANLQEFWRMSGESEATTVSTDEFVKKLTLRCLPGVSHRVQQQAPERSTL